MKNLTSHVMNSTDTNAGGYTGSDMYTFVHNTVLPNLKKSGLNIIACDLVSENIYNDICSKTGKTSKDIACDYFWLADPGSSDHFYYVDSDGSIGYGLAGGSGGVRPLITITVK